MKPTGEYCPKCGKELERHPSNYRKFKCTTCSTGGTIVYWSIEFLDGVKYAKGEQHHD